MRKPLPMRLTQVDPARRAKIKETIALLAREAQGRGELPDPSAIRRQLRKSRLINMTRNAVHMHLYAMGIPHVGCQTALNPVVSTKEQPVSTEEVGIDTAAQIEYLRKELRTSRSQETKALQRLGGQDDLYQKLLLEVRALPPAPQAHVWKPQEATEHTQDCLCQMACMHIGEQTSPEKLYGLGDYDLRMARARVQSYVDTVIHLAMDKHQGETFPRLWAIMLGDMVNGTIHNDLIRNAEFGIERQIAESAQLMAWALRDWAAYFPQVTFIGYSGNHGRIFKEPEYMDRADNYDTIAYRLVKEMVRDIPNVEVRIPRSLFTIEEINGHRFLFTHGDMIRAWAGISWYGKNKARANLKELAERLGLSFEYFCLSHFHTLMNVQETYGETLFTGSSKGPCGFSVGAIAAGSDPKWWFYGVDDDIGVSFRYPVNMAKATRDDPSGKGYYNLRYRDSYGGLE